jgi:outer membrane protein assembly factor BamB
MTSLRLPLLLAGLAGLAALGSAPAQAQDLYLGSRTTQVTRNDFLDGDSTLVGLCGGIVQSTTTLGGKVYIGDVTGNVYVHDPATGSFGYAFTASNDATALESHAGDLLVGGSDGSILRYDVTTGTLKAGLVTGSAIPVHAMVLVDNGLGEQLIVGSLSGLIQSGDPVTGGFQFWASCGNDINALASDGDQLFAADVGGTIWRFEVVTQGFIASFPVASQGHSLALVEGDLMVGCEDGVVRRLQHHSGAIKSSFAAGFPVDALAVMPEPEPGVAFCQGVVCPCGNNDAENACINSTGFGSGLVATGSASVAVDDLELVVYDLPPGVPGRFYMGQIQGNVPFGDGLLCVGAGGYPVFRLQFGFADAFGVLRTGEGMVGYTQANLGAAGHITPGSTWHFQAWYRDPKGPCGQTFNTTSAYTVTFLP